ncbi:MAG: tRNA dihydrouridine synthase DusB [Candidatus Gygaella obscura]|nr:tRNA dihydrouridine synthase DusB [Candidatus Gygaella obscura]
MLSIGNLKLKSNLILSPLAGISDLPFRMINRKFGCHLAFVEMINVRSLSHKSKKTKRMLSTLKADSPLGVQLLGFEEDFIKKAIDILQYYRFNVLDFNCACPEKKVVRRGEGAALLKDPKKIQRILKIMVKRSNRPVTVKIRIGFNSESVNAKEVALCAQDAGVKALFIHGRTREQFYKPGVDYDTIRRVKEALSIPVIASGDIFSGALAKRMLDETGCDGLAVARGSFGNPWIFKEIKAFLKGKSIKKPNARQVYKVMRPHFKSCVKFYGPIQAVGLFRKFFNWYVKGFSDVRTLREKACYAKKETDMLEVMKTFYKIHK